LTILSADKVDRAFANPTELDVDPISTMVIPRMSKNYDAEKVDEMVLALLHLTSVTALPDTGSVVIPIRRQIQLLGTSHS
jgi:hypothetical protein